MFTRQISEIKYSSNYSSKYDSDGKSKYSTIQRLIDDNLKLNDQMSSPRKLENIQENLLEKSLLLDSSQISNQYSEYQDEQIRTEMIKMFKS
jgi:hypothetical protein